MTEAFFCVCYCGSTVITSTRVSVPTTASRLWRLRRPSGGLSSLPQRRRRIWKSAPFPTSHQPLMCKYRCASLDILPLCQTKRASTLCRETFPSLRRFLPLSPSALRRAEALTSHFTGWSVFPGGESGLGPDKKCSVPAG